MRAYVFWLEDRPARRFRGVLVIFQTRVPSVWRRLAAEDLPEPLSGLVAAPDADALVEQLDALQPGNTVGREAGTPLSKVVGAGDIGVFRVTFVGAREFPLAAPHPSGVTLQGWTERVYAHMKP